MTDVWIKKENSKRVEVVVFEIEPHNLKTLILALSNSIINGVRELPVKENEQEYLLFSPYFKGLLPYRGRLHYEGSGYINILQEQVTFIYETICAYVDVNTSPFGWSDTTADVITEALHVYQQWKTRVCEDSCRVNGEAWGAKTGFYTQDWTDHNERFLALFKEGAECGN